MGENHEKGRGFGLHQLLNRYEAQLCLDVYGTTKSRAYGEYRSRHIASGTVMPSHASARSATAAVANRNCLRAGPSSVRIW